MKEKDIEDLLYRNPSAINVGVFSDDLLVNEWIARQFTVPSGRIDLLGVYGVNYKLPIVVEIKNTVIDAKAVAQVCRYADDISSILRRIDSQNDEVLKVVVGRGPIPNDLLLAAWSIGVGLITFQEDGDDIHLSRVAWMAYSEYKKLDDVYEKLSKQSIFDVFRDYEKPFAEFMAQIEEE